MLNSHLGIARAYSRKSHFPGRWSRTPRLIMSKATLESRHYGVLLHPTSLPGPYPIGDLGEGARNFVMWLRGAGASSWQILPLVPPGSGWSPYSTWASLLGNALLISLEDLVMNELLVDNDLPNIGTIGKYVDYDASISLKKPLLDKAACALIAGRGSHTYLSAFSSLKLSNNSWVQEAAVFHLLELEFGQSWWKWPDAYRWRDSDAMENFRQKNAYKIEMFIAQQSMFYVQWNLLKNFANSKGINLIGDLPIYVSHHSVDVWCNRQLFELKEDGTPKRVAGCPPDAFSPTGQYWGSPLYEWSAHSKSNYSWWIERMNRSLEMYDKVRIDHFRGFAGFWAIKYPSKTAISGEWQAGPHASIFEAMESSLRKTGSNSLPIIAEDLGDISSDVHNLRDNIGLPGIRVLQFGFGDDCNNIHLSSNYKENTVCYPATHDNDTCIGFYQSCTFDTLESLKAQYNISTTDVGFGLDSVSLHMITDALSSKSSCAIITLQDLLGKGSESRMNTPSIAEGNWLWRACPDDISLKVALHMRELAGLYGRLA